MRNMEARLRFLLNVDDEHPQTLSPYSPHDFPALHGWDRDHSLP